MHESSDRVLRDRFERPLKSLRISVTDRCNLRCSYCMPEHEYVWLPRESLLSFEEMQRLAGVFAGLGVRKLRLTGGEPLLRHDLTTLVGMLASVEGVEDLALTTNGIMLGRSARDLRDAGLSRLTVSLDTLRPERFQDLTRSGRHADVMQGIQSALDAGFPRTKVNCVIVRGYNDDEIIDLLEFGRAKGVEVRFIEYMDVGGATRWDPNRVVSREEMLETIGKRYGEVESLSPDDPNAPAQRFSLPEGPDFGIIASTTAPFCGTCDRSRLTADGMWYLCLYAARGHDLKENLRRGASDEEIRRMITEVWADRTDRGAEERLADIARGVLYQVSSLRRNPHLEMHTRGG
jgi:cyclic pyranopterin phosphate synthase